MKLVKASVKDPVFYASSGWFEMIASLIYSLRSILHQNMALFSNECKVRKKKKKIVNDFLLR